MKSFIKIISVFLSVMMLFGIVASFASCKSEEKQDESKTFNIIENGATSYKIVRADKANQNTIDNVSSFHSAITEKFGCKVELTTDWLKAGEKADPAALEILVGNTNRDETAEVKESLEPNSWAVVNKGNKVVICASNDALLEVALNWFITKYVAEANAVLAIPENLNKVEGYAEEIPLIINGNTSYKIVYPKDNANLEYFASLVARHTEIAGDTLDVVSDNKTETTYEILIGATAHTGSLAVSGDKEYKIAVDGTKIAIGASDEDTLYYAVNYFLEYGLNVQETMVSIKSDFSASGKLDGYTGEKWELPIPAANFGMLAPAYNLGTGLASDLEADTVIDSRMHLVSRATKENFVSYGKLLEKFGFKCVYSATTDQNVLNGYRLGKALVYVHFAPAQKYVRVIWDKSSNCEISDFEYTAEGSEHTTFYQYSLDYTAADLNFSGKGINCGMLYIIRLADNSLILVDCGHTNQACEKSLQGLYEFLYGITGTSVDDPLHIRFWYYTHPDGDHTELTSLFIDYIRSKNLNMPRIDTLGFNFPSERANDKLSKTPGSYKMIEYMNRFYPDVNYVKLHTGMVFNVGEVKVEVLGTIENIINTQGKLNANYSTNDTCSLIRFSFNDISFLMTGDIGNDTSVQKYHVEMYSKEFFKSDVIQVSHHGYNKIYDIYDHADGQYALISNSEKTASNEVFIYFKQKITVNNIFFAGDYTFAVHKLDGKIRVYGLYRYDNPLLKK